MPADRKLVLPLREGLATGHTQLPFHQINAGNRLCHRMFHLQAGVHFHEPEPVLTQPVRAIDDKLNRPRARITNRLSRAHCRIAHCLAHALGHARCRRFLNHLLVTTLQGTVPFKQMHRMGAIAKDLHLDMARRGHEFLNQHRIIAKGGFGFAHRTGQSRIKIALCLYQTHAFAAATGHSLNQHRIADLRSFRFQKLRVLILAMIARHHRYTGLNHQSLRRILQPHRPDRFCRRANESHPRRFTGFHKIGVFREKPIARMDPLCARILRHLQNAFLYKITVRRRIRPDMHGFIRHCDMFRLRIRIRINRHGFHAHAARCFHHPAGNLTPVCNQDFLKHRFLPLYALLRGLPADFSPGQLR